MARYRSTRPDDTPLRVRLRELAAERRRFGYRRLGYLLAREGMTPNHKKLLRIYREEGLRVRRRSGRKRALGTRAPMTIPQGPNQRWSLDFVSDSFICGRRFRILCVVDDFSRECPGTACHPINHQPINGRTLPLSGNNQGSTSPPNRYFRPPELSIGVQTGPPIGAQKGPPSRRGDPLMEGREFRSAGGVGRA